MTPEQHYSRKMAELLGWSDDGNWFTCISLNEKNVIKRHFDSIYYDKDELEFHSCWKWQITVWQKVYAKYLAYIKTNPINLAYDQESFQVLKDKYFNALTTSTPTESFNILCKCIDLIENNTKEK